MPTRLENYTGGESLFPTDTDSSYQSPDTIDQQTPVMRDAYLVWDTE